MSNDDLGQIVHRMTKRKNEGCKNSLKNELLQYRDAVEVKRRIPDDWKTFLYEQIGLKKSSLFSGIKIYKEFGQLLLVPVDGAEGDEAVDVICEYSTIPSSSLKLLLKVAQGCDDSIKEAWLNEAASLSFTDFKKRIDEATGKTICDCIQWKKKEIEVCVECGKRRAQDKDGDA